MTVITVLVGVPAFAQSLPFIWLSPTEGASPATTFVEGSGFAGLGLVAITVDGQPAGSTAAGSDGILAPLEITIEGEPGTVDVTACQSGDGGERCRFSATANFVILKPVPGSSTTTSEATTTSSTTTTIATTTTVATTTTTAATTTTTEAPARSTTSSTEPPVVTEPEPTLGPNTPVDSGDGDGAVGFPQWPWLLAGFVVGAGGLGVWLAARNRDADAGPPAHNPEWTDTQGGDPG